MTNADQPTPDADRVSKWALAIREDAGLSLSWGVVPEKTLALADSERADDKARIAELEDQCEALLGMRNREADQRRAAERALTVERAKVARVEALAEQWEMPGLRINAIRSEVIAHHLRAALAEPDGDAPAEIPLHESPDQGAGSDVPTEAK